jgi:hypothetical protein
LQRPASARTVALRERRHFGSSRTATVLSAVAAAAAMWIATSETSWAHALSRVSAWREVASSWQPEHVVEPASVADDTLSTAHVAEPLGGVGAPSPVFTSGAPKRVDIDLALGADEPALAAGTISGAEEREDHGSDDAARRARRAARAKARAERSSTVEQPALVITPSAEPAQAPGQEQEAAYDRDLVLNPFGE